MDSNPRQVLSDESPFNALSHAMVSLLLLMLIVDSGIS